MGDLSHKTRRLSFRTLPSEVTHGAKPVWLGKHNPAKVRSVESAVSSRLLSDNNTTATSAVEVACYLRSTPIHVRFQNSLVSNNSHLLDHKIRSKHIQQEGR